MCVLVPSGCRLGDWEGRRTEHFYSDDLLENAHMGGRGGSEGGSSKRLVGNFLGNQFSNGLRGGANIGYPNQIHCPNGVAGQAL